MNEMTLTARLETLKEQQSLLESEARADRTLLIEKLREACEIVGPVPRELLEGIIAGRRRGPKPGAKKGAPARKPRTKKTADATVLL